MLRIQILTELKEEGRLSPYMELLYVAEGRAAVQGTGGKRTLRAGELDLFAPGEPYSAATAGHSLILRLLFPPAEAENGGGALVPDREAYLSNATDLRRTTALLAAMLTEFAEKQRKTRLRLLYDSIFDLLAGSYMTRRVRADSSPLAELLDQIAEDPAGGPTLKECARQLYLSESAFSRRFQRETGQSFSSYVAQLRLLKAAALLRETDAGVAEIAEKAGFKSSAVMQRHFRRTYGCTPLAYRKMRYAGSRAAEAAELKTALARMAARGQGVRIRRAEVRAERGTAVRKCEMQCVCLGNVSLLLDADIRAQVEDIPRILDVHHVAVCNIFDPALRIREGHGTAPLHFERLDRALDALIAIGCIPVLILPESRTVEIRDIGDQAAEDGSEPVFLDGPEWEAVFYAFLKHALERYTYAGVRKWCFILEHAPELDTEAASAKFRDFYRRSYVAIRSIVPDAAIYANTLNPSVLPEILRSELRWWSSEGLLPDALNLMIYPYRVEVERGERAKAISLLRIDADLHFVREELDAYRSLAEEAGAGQLPLVVSEWNTSLSEWNPYNDSCAKACHMLAQMADACTRAERMFYRGFSDLAVSGFGKPAPFIGATALLSRDGIRKPSWYAMEFWGRLGSRLLSVGNNYIVATSHGVAFQILLYHPLRMSEEYKLIPESAHRMDELTVLSGSDERLRFEIRFPEICEKRRMRVYYMSDAAGAAYSEWLHMGSPDYLTPSELRYLRARSIPSLVVCEVQPDAEGLLVTAELEPNAFSLILLG